MDEVRVYSLEGQFLQVARRYERERGAHPQPTPQTSETPLDHEYLKLLEERHRQQTEDETQRGLDYHRAQNQAAWSLPQFAATFAKLLGRKGGVSGLSAAALERLSQFHHRHPRITSSLLEEAFQQAEVKTIPVIVFYLQTLYVTRNERNA